METKDPPAEPGLPRREPKHQSALPIQEEGGHEGNMVSPVLKKGAHGGNMVSPMLQVSPVLSLGGRLRI
jgi:hypothetical protein